MENLIRVLGEKLELDAEEIADIFWLGLLQWQSETGAAMQIRDGSVAQDREADRGDLLVSPAIEVDSDLDVLLEETIPPPMGQLQMPPPTAEESLEPGMAGTPIAIPDASALRGTLALLRALKPLLRKVPTLTGSTLDEAVTVERIAETDLWIPEVQPDLEPWLELALVVDASASMLIWRRLIVDVQRLLRQSGIFRDVRLWSLEVSASHQVQLRPGYGVATAQVSPCSYRELIDPNRRRVIWLVTDCIDARWQSGSVDPVLKVWAKHGVMALVQVLPEWLWDRTALQEVSKVRFYGLEAGLPNEQLRVRRRDRWQRPSRADIKVPVITLEPSVTQRWSQMVAGQGAIGAAGLIFTGSAQNDLEHPELTPQQRVERFRVLSSPIARRLAGLLSACPVVSLPIIRIVQDAMLKESEQVHVAEVLYGGLFKLTVLPDRSANPDTLEYQFQDRETQRLLIGSTPPPDTFHVLSRWVSQRFGASLDEFVAILQDPQQDLVSGQQARAFAGVAIDVLWRQGGRYAQIAEAIQTRWFGNSTVPGEEEATASNQSLTESEFLTEELFDWQILEFETGQLVPVGIQMPLLQTQRVEVATVVIETEEDLEPFTVEVATLEWQGGVFGLGGRLRMKRRRQQAYQYVEPLGDGIVLEMVAIPAGQFLMGSPLAEKESSDDERPQHRVSVQAFFMSKYPVTQVQWRAIASLPAVNRELEPDPSYFKGDRRPVERVSWWDAVECCDRLSRKTGREYRLPAEAEWEYACRAGTTTPFHFGETITADLANYDATEIYGKGVKGEYRKETTPVDQFGVANAFGLCEIHGNIWEWCLDHWHDNYNDNPLDGSAWLTEDENAPRVVRGGSWAHPPRYCRSAYRSDLVPDTASNDLGLRLVCVVPRILQ